MRITNLAGIRPMETVSFMWMTGQRDTPGCVQLVLQKRDSMIRTQNRLWIGANEIVNDNPYEAYTSIVNNVATMIQTGRSSYVQINPIIVFLAAAVIGAIFVGVQLIGHGGKDTVLRSTYAKGDVQMNEKQDIFLHSHVTRTKRPSKSSSGGGKVGGTGGHGGAGGRH